MASPMPPNRDSIGQVLNMYLCGAMVGCQAGRVALFGQIKVQEAGKELNHAEIRTVCLQR